MKDYKRQEKMDHDRAWLDGMIAQAQMRRFYGRLTVMVEDGVIHRVLKEESMIPPKKE